MIVIGAVIIVVIVVVVISNYNELIESQILLIYFSNLKITIHTTRSGALKTQSTYYYTGILDAGQSMQLLE